VYEKDYAAPGNAIINAVYTQFQHLPIAGVDGATAGDVAIAWERIVSRMHAAPHYIGASEKLVTHPGHLYGIVGSQELAGGPEFFNGPLTDAAKTQLAPDRMPAFVAARDATVAALAAEKKYVDAHVAGWPENFAMGQRAYDAMLRDEQLLPFDSKDLARMAADELARGWAEQAWDVDAARARNTAIGADSGGGIAPDGLPLIAYYQDRIEELRDFVTTHEVVDIPAWLGKVEVVATPKFLQPIDPGATMISPLTFSKGTTGFYYIAPSSSLEAAAKRLDPNQDFDRDRILETAAHEAMPGHFLQLSIARRHPDFVRVIQSSASFSEGWAFYGEEMLWQLGLYGDRLDARYDAAQWERVRGARAIVDAELASGRWSFERAVQYFAGQTQFPIDQAKAAVAGYALAPGYVVSYTAGRYQLQSLLGEYLARTGAHGKLLDFHDRLLCYGSTPFSILGPELLADLDKPLAQVRAAANY
jgi:hypothetical protein